MTPSAWLQNRTVERSTDTATCPVYKGATRYGKKDSPSPGVPSADARIHWHHHCLTTIKKIEKMLPIQAGLLVFIFFKPSEKAEERTLVFVAEHFCLRKNHTACELLFVPFCYASELMLQLNSSKFGWFVPFCFLLVPELSWFPAPG